MYSGDKENPSLKDMMDLSNTNFPLDPEKNKIIEKNILNDQSKIKTEINKLDVDHYDEQSKNSNCLKIIVPTKNKSLNEDKMVIDDDGGKDDTNLKNTAEQSLKPDTISDKENDILLKDKSIHINKLKKDSNSPLNENEIINFLNEVEELKNKKISFAKKNLNSLGDKIDLSQKFKLMGNKERKKTGKLIIQLENSIEATGFTSKNPGPGSINIEEEEKNEIKNQKYQKELIKKLIICSIKNIKVFINERAKLLYNIDLNYNYITQLYEIDINNLEKYLELTIMEIYLGKYCILNDEKDKGNVKFLIGLLLRKENENKNHKFKLLNKLFNKKIKELLLLYIDDDPYLLIKKKNKENTKFNLKRFNTFKDDFKEDNLNEKIEMEEYIHSSDKNIDEQNEEEEKDEQNEEEKDEQNEEEENEEQNEEEKNEKQNEEEENDEQNEEEENDEQNEEEKSEKQNENEELSKEKIEKPNNKDLNNKFVTSKENNQKNKIQLKFFKKRKIINAAKENIHKFIVDKCVKYKEKPPHMPYLKNQIGKNIKEYSAFFNTNFYTIYINYLPKSLNKQSKEDKKFENYKDQILNIIEKEKEIIEKEKSKNEQIRIIYILFNKKVYFKHILKAFLNDENYITITDENDETVSLEGFITYKDCFNDELSKEEKEAYRIHLLQIMNGEIKSRKISENRNIKLKNNPNLRKKRKRDS